MIIIKTNHNMIKSCLMLFLFSLSFFMLEAQLSYTGSEITVNFSDYTGQGLAPEPAAGQLDSDNWRIIGLSDGDSSWGGTHTTGDFARGQSNADGGATSGGLYSFLNNDAIYIKPTATDLTPGTIVLRIKNETGHALNHVQVDYDILTRNFGDRGQNFEFFWTVGSDPETEETSVYFISPETKSIASPIPVEYVGKSVEFDLSLPDNGTLNLRWRSNNQGGSGSRDFIGIDNISVKHAIAHITGNYYYTLADALSNATAGSTVVLTNPTDEIDLTIPLGVTLEISAGLEYNNTNTLINNGTINILGGGIFTNTGIYKGSGVFKGGFINNGTISPGN